MERNIVALRLIKYEMILFNQNFSTIVQLTKNIACTTAIVGGFGSLKLWSKNILFSLVFGNIFVVGILAFTITFNPTYQITETVEELKREILAKSRKMCTRGQVREVEKILKSVQTLRIRAGGFNYMERESTLIFLDFVSQQILSLLLTFS